MEEIERNVSGYYAMGIFDSEGRLHVIRDDKASLYISYSKTVDSFIIATTDTIIENIASAMRWKFEPPMPLQDNSYLTFIGNECVASRAIVPRAAIYTASAARALGKTDYLYADDGDNGIPQYRRWSNQ